MDNNGWMGDIVWYEYSIWISPRLGVDFVVLRVRRRRSRILGH
jgi:hypothetical protein